MQVIIYPNEDGGVSVVYPAPEFAAHIEAVAAKDVPTGKAWRIIDASELPDKGYRDRWRWTASGPLSVATESQGE
jgi:hypothetical protein